MRDRVSGGGTGRRHGERRACDAFHSAAARPGVDRPLSRAVRRTQAGWDTRTAVGCFPNLATIEHAGYRHGYADARAAGITDLSRLRSAAARSAGAGAGASSQSILTLPAPRS